MDRQDSGEHEWTGRGYSMVKRVRGDQDGLTVSMKGAMLKVVL